MQNARAGKQTWKLWAAICLICIYLYINCIDVCYKISYLGNFMKYIDTMHRTIAEQSGQELGSQGDSQESSVKTEFPTAALDVKNVGFV